MFRRLFSGKKKEKESSATPKLSRAIESQIIGTVGGKAIPAMPGAAQKAFQLTTDPNAEARDFIEVIESDESLAARVVKIANSVYFDRGKKSNTIEESVTVIGINELRSLLNATTLSELFPSNHPARTQAWTNDISTAIIAKNLALRFLNGKQDLAFMAGLMHDIGKLLLIQRVGDLYLKVNERVAQTGCSFCEAEEQVFPFVHTEVGQLIGEQWKFTDELIASIRYHHDPWPNRTLSQAEIRLPMIIQCSDTISHSLGLGHPKGFSQFQRNCEESLVRVWETLGIQSSESRDYLANLKRSVESEMDLYSGGKL